MTELQKVKDFKLRVWDFSILYFFAFRNESLEFPEE